MSPTSLFLLLLLAAATTSSSSTPSPAGPYMPPTVQELLDAFRLPRGLLPLAARRYLLHDDGTFELYLDEYCDVRAGGYTVRYGTKIFGRVRTGEVTRLRGVRVRAFLFVWVPVTGVEVDGGVVTVSVGPVKKSFPAVGFRTSPRCRNYVTAMADGRKDRLESSSSM